jgi:RimJ/RimL family protein N-acetyltransferase
MLCNDQSLRRDLGIPAHDHPTAESFLDKIHNYCRDHRATTFAIITDDTAIGTISLSNRNPDDHSAGIGYWIGTGYRCRGHCPRAFAAVLRLALDEGITTVSAEIDSDNLPSRRIWEHHRAESTPVSPGRVKYVLTLNSQLAHILEKSNCALIP